VQLPRVPDERGSTCLHALASACESLLCGCVEPLQSYTLQMTLAEGNAAIMQGASRSRLTLDVRWRALQRTHEWSGEVRERAPRPAALHGFQQRHGAGRKGGGAADAQRLVEQRIHHAGRQLAAPPDDLLGSRNPADQL